MLDWYGSLLTRLFIGPSASEYTVWSIPNMLTVAITLDAEALDPYASSRNKPTVQGKLEDAISHISKHVDVTQISIDEHHCYIDGTTLTTAPLLIAALYSNADTATRIKSLRTNLNLLALSSTEQQHVPTEEEIIAHENRRSHANTAECYGPGYGCDPDYCIKHDV